MLRHSKKISLLVETQGVSFIVSLTAAGLGLSYITGPVIETSLINRTHLSRSEDGRTDIFRNVVSFIFYIFIFYILYFMHIKDDGQIPRNKWFTM
jgi:hypothetical protein